MARLPCRSVVPIPKFVSVAIYELRNLRTTSNPMILVPPLNPKFAVAFWGAVRAGVVVIPLNTFLTIEAYGYILADSRASAIVAAAPLVRNLLPVLDRAPALRTVILLSAVAADMAAFPRHEVHGFEN